MVRRVKVPTRNLFLTTDHVFVPSRSRRFDRETLSFRRLARL